MPLTSPSQSLRVLGQEFEKHQVTDFEVVIESDGCQVRASLPPRPPAPPPPASRSWSLKGLFKQEAKAPAPEIADESPETLEHKYAWSDLAELDEAYRTQRRRPDGVPDDYSTSQVLRVVGAYVERQQWPLAGVARTRHVIEIRYRKPDGQLAAVSQKFAELYDFAVRLSKSREVGAAPAH